MYKTAYLVRW